MTEPRKPRVIFWDIETSYSIGAYFDKYRENNILETLQDWFLLSFAYKVQGESKIHVHTLADYPGYSKNLTNDKALVTDLHRLVFSPDTTCLVAHNGDKFDSRKAKARFLAHNLPPTPPIKTIDTLKLFRRITKMDSNKLEDIALYFGLGGKVEHEGKGLWKKCMQGDRDAHRRMAAYNKHDVHLLEQVYDRIIPWHPNPPVLRHGPGCAHCGSTKAQSRGFNLAKASRTPRFQCLDCHGWYSGQREKAA